MTLVDNSGASSLVILADRLDRYYFAFDSHYFTSASLDGSAELNEFADVEVLAPGSRVQLTDVFGAGLPKTLGFPR